MKAYVVGSHLNCIDKLVQFKWVPTTSAEIDEHPSLRFQEGIIKCNIGLVCYVLLIIRLILSKTTDISNQTFWSFGI